LSKQRHLQPADDGGTLRGRIHRFDLSQRGIRLALQCEQPRKLECRRRSRGAESLRGLQVVDRVTRSPGCGKCDAEVILDFEVGRVSGVRGFQPCDRARVRRRDRPGPAERHPETAGCLQQRYARGMCDERRLVARHRG
jgi:hypothetical protein